MLNAMYVAAFSLAVNYYFTTFTIWFGHWSSHSRHSPLRGFHMGGHHALYPDSRSSLSRTFLYGSGRHDSLFALLPPLLAQLVILGLAAPSWLRPMLWLETAALAAGVSWLHAQFHRKGSTLSRFGWFPGARAAHFAHHDRDVNFMVGDLFWDRLLRTHETPPSADRGSHPPTGSIPVGSSLRPPPMARRVS